MSTGLSNEERTKISCSLGESHFREFKSAFHGPLHARKPRAVTDICKDVAEALVAFANADGGEIIIGVEDNGHVTGTNELSDEQMESINQSDRTHVFHKTPLSSVRKIVAYINGSRVISFSVSKSTNFVHQTSDGRCLKRNDLETVPISADQLILDRKEIQSKEYDRQYVDGTVINDLDGDLLQITADHISKGMSPEKCLQYLGLADYRGPDEGFIFRKAALLLFAKDISRWHPRCQVRIMKVNGLQLGAGTSYNVVSDEIVRDNVIKIIDKSWDLLRPFLAQTLFHQDAKFKLTYMYPENACREALTNAIAHRDYADEGSGIEIYIFDDRIEIRNPGGLLSSISIDDLLSLKGTHQSRNANVSRTLRELGFMRELGEGMRRIFELMESNELAPPEIEDDSSGFALTLHHKTMYSADEMLWLDQYKDMSLSAEEKAIALLGRDGRLVAPQDIWDRLGIVDTEHYRKLIASLQEAGILKSEVRKSNAYTMARKRRIGVKKIPRFRILKIGEVKVGGGKAKSKQVTDSETDRTSKRDRTLFVANIPFNTSEREIHDVFIVYGDIEDITIPMNGYRNRGYCFVEFSEPSAMQSALSEQGYIELSERRLRVGPALVRRK